MNEQLAHTPFSADASEVKASTDTWILAKKRANDYLKLHRLPEAEREHLLTRITHKLARAGLFSEQELIQLFISTAQKELALLQVTEEKSTKISLEEQDAKADRTQTGPRFERSSIRVAPLQAITLLPTSRQRLGIK
ncbi:hypothetical protein [Thiothrix lacustris]|uniref:hypothetical protein n=1 Tax=Thiothrix lacustris TaxID=525917 RepID=UPI0027E58377|nr:hypothetical protein [Thiothrix lacustris]WMP18879.1 hypothetical protein RCS87_07395 [Thiothrix lacustris]